MKRSEYIQKRKEIEADCQDKLTALDKVFAMFGGTPVSHRSETSAAARGWTYDISKREAVRLAIKKLPVGTFTSKDVRQALEADQSAQITDNQLSAILSAFAAKKQIGIHTKKYGASPAIYEHKAAS